jgi:hypothetical protein
MTIIIYAVGNSYKDICLHTPYITVRPIFEMLSTSRGSDRVYPETLKNRTPNVAGALQENPKDAKETLRKAYRNPKKNPKKHIIHFFLSSVLSFDHSTTDQPNASLSPWVSHPAGPMVAALG